MTKRCNRCNIEKELTEFRSWTSPSYKEGIRYSNACLVCANYQAVWKNQNKHSVLKKIKPTQEQLTKIKMLLVRHEYGFFNMIDHFKVMSIHFDLEIDFQEAHLTSANITPNERLDLMLEHLKYILEYNGIYRVDKI